METGDLVFSYIGREGNAISAVTAGYGGGRVNHVGVIVRNGFGLFVLEAFPPEVRLTHIDVFARRSQDESGIERMMFGRLEAPYAALIDSAIRYGLDQRDIPYDRLYLSDEAKLYCSELVVDMFKYANDGVEFFAETPMSFRDNVSGEIHPEWIAYYAYFGLGVPDGHPGSNPGDISLDPKVAIYDIRGNIPGLRR